MGSPGKGSLSYAYGQIYGLVLIIHSCANGLVFGLVLIIHSRSKLLQMTAVFQPFFDFIIGDPYSTYTFRCLTTNSRTLN